MLRKFSSSAGIKRVMVAIANGSEEIETVSVVDILRRAQAEVTVAKVDGKDGLMSTMSRGVKIEADTRLEKVENEEFDAIVLPGGLKGAEAFRDSQMLVNMVSKYLQNKEKVVCAICASPAVVLSHHGLLKGYKATCYPAFEIPDRLDDPVVRSENLLTS